MQFPVVFLLTCKTNTSKCVQAINIQLAAHPRNETALILSNLYIDSQRVASIEDHGSDQLSTHNFNFII